MKSRLRMVCLSLLFLVTQHDAYAGDINLPTHLPNRAINKINQVRLLGLTAERDNESRIDEELGELGIGSLNQSGCNLNVGNSIGAAPRLSGDRDVIINGDIINFCK